jgi:DNA-binding HxlR family transcriptional regulator
MVKEKEKVATAPGECLEKSECTNRIIPVRDALDILSGKWKLPIIISLTFGNKRFSQIAREIPGITDRMLSKELRDLEMNQLVKRTVYDTVPVLVEYEMTTYGKTLHKLIDELHRWGAQHRKRIMKKDVA